MKITEIRTRAIQWTGKTVPLPPHFCTNPMDAVSPMLTKATMGTFTFHGWLLVEIFTDNGLVGIGNAALSPLVTKQVIDSYLKPLLIGADPWDIEFLWQHMYRKTMAFGRKGIAMVAISAVDIALWDLLGKSAKQPVYRLLGGRTKPKIPVYASRLYSTPLKELASEATKYKKQGYQAMKLRFGWGPTDGPEGMQKNVALVRTVRETVGDGVDIMADAYMGWNLDYAKRMIPLLEKYNLRWLEEAVIPDDIHGYAELKRARAHDLRFPPTHGSTRGGLYSVRYQPRRRSHAGAQNFRARRGAFHPGHSARRPNAQLSRSNGQSEFADGGIFPARRCRSRQRAVLVYLQWRADTDERLHRSR